MQDKKIKERKRTGVCEGGSFSERSSSLALPPEERLAFGLAASASLVPPERWVRFLAARLWSRRLTEPPRPCEMGERTLPPAYGGHLPFQGRLCSDSLQKAPSAEGAVSRRDHSQVYRRHTHPLRRNQAKRTAQLERQPLFGRGPGGGASLREAASPGVPHSFVNSILRSPPFSCKIGEIGGGFCVCCSSDCKNDGVL